MGERQIDEEIETRFTYHPPTGDQPQRYEQIRAAAKEFAYLIKELTPVSRERDLAEDALDAVVMFANAAIARRS